MGKKKGKNLIHPNGVTVRLPNRKIRIEETEDCFWLELNIVDASAERPEALQKILKGKVRQTILRLSKDAMIEMVVALNSYLNNKQLSPLPQQNK